MSLNQFVLRLAVAASVLACALSLVGCSAPGAATITTLQAAFFSKSPIDSTPLQPGLSYLRVQQAGNLAILVLGDIDPHPLGPIQVWYSGQREVLKIQNGRIVGTAGLSTDWQHVRLDPVVTGFKRVRDVMPGYLTGLEDHLSTKNLSEPPRDLVKRFKNPERVLGADVKWVEERSDRFHDLGPSFIAFGKNQEAIAGHACLTTELCISWERLQ